MAEEYLWTGESAYCKCGHHIIRHVNWEKLMEVEPDDPDICCTGDVNCPCDEFRPDKVKPNSIITVDNKHDYE
ncbi:MAG: hypothetical protein WBX01_06470 [Nitrososphaeraceae archaeon]